MTFEIACYGLLNFAIPSLLCSKRWNKEQFILAGRSSGAAVSAHAQQMPSNVALSAVKYQYKPLPTC